MDHVSAQRRPEGRPIPWTTLVLNASNGPIYGQFMTATMQKRDLGAPGGAGLTLNHL